MKSILLFYCLSFFLLHISVCAQKNVLTPNNASEYFFEQISVEQGLSHSTIRDIAQDKQGFLWFSTWSGLNRYDGFIFKKYYSDPVDTNSLSDNTLRGIGIDNDGKLWIGSTNGLNVYDPKLDKVSQVSDLFNENDVNKEILYAQKDKNGDLWFASNDQVLFNYAIEKSSFTRYSIPRLTTGMDYVTVQCLLVTSDNNLLLGTTEGLYSIDIDSSKASAEITIKQIIKNKDVHSLAEDENKNLWIGTLKGVFTFPDKYLVKKVGVNLQKHITSLIVSKNQELWIGTQNGLEIYNLRNKNREGYFFPYKYVDKIFEDNSKIIWVSIRGEGLFKFNKERKQFPAPIDVDAQISSVFEDEGKNVWMGSGKGIHKIDHLTNKIKKYDVRSRPPYTFYKDKKGKLYAGVIGVVEYSGELDAFIPLNINYTISPDFKPDEDYTNFGYVFALYEDDEYLWIGCFRGLLKYEFKTQRISKILDKSTGKSLFPNFVKVIHKDKNNNMWIGSTSGLFWFDPKSEESKHFISNQNDPYSISDNFVSDIIDSKEKDVLWLATGNGLNNFNIKTGKFSNYTTTQGLSNNGLINLYYDEKGFLWISTNNGISRFDPQKETFKNYYKSDGLQDNVFYPGHFKNADGKMFFGGPGGVTAFYPDSIKDDINVPEIVITGFKKFNKIAKLDTAINYLKHITLQHNENVFSFEYAAMNFTNPLRIQFAHKLEGFDKDWIFTGNKHDVTYMNLDPGEYIFHVKGTNHDGIWNEQGTSLKITILPPLWATWWAYLIYIISLLIVIYILRRYELNRLSLKHGMALKNSETRKLQELDHLKSKFFANISHEFRTPLTLILGPIEQFVSDPLLEKYRKKFININANARRLLELINQLLDLSRLEAKQLNIEVSQVDIVKITRAIVAAFESMAKQRKIKLRFDPAVEDLTVWLDANRYEKVIANLLSNAFKFSQDDTSIIIELHQKPLSEIFPEGCVEIKVTDQGKGIPDDKIARVFNRFYQVEDNLSRSYEGSGIGLALVKELVDLHSGTIKVESKLNSGTIFSIELPLGKSHLKESEIVVNPVFEEAELAESFLQDNDKVNVESACEKEKATILIVEDNNDMQQYIAEVLTDNYNLAVACNGLQGLQVASEKMPDLILSDVMMPEMNGMQMCEKLKTDKVTSHIPVILLTARAGEESKLEGLETGADDYLEKPFNKKELLVRVKNLIKQRKILRNKFEENISLNVSDMDINQTDKSFLKEIINCIEKNMGNGDFSIDHLAKEIFLSRTQLHRKLTALSGKNATDFVRGYRLAKAAELLSKKQGNVSQVAYETGFNSLNYFSKVFKEQFGVLPSEYLHKS